MIYNYDKNSLKYRKVTFKWFIWFTLLILTAIATTSFITYKNVNKVENINEETRAIIIREASANNVFSKDNLKAYLLELNVKYPHIVLAQSELETANYTSTIFRENNNLFGIKLATRRASTAKGTDNNHAYYEHWKQSVVDYAFLQSTFILKIHNEDEYFEYLRKYYAEDTAYVPKLKFIISKEFIKKDLVD